MPTPDRTSLDAIVAAAIELLEREGIAGVTMQAVAQRVGVRAPSLYKRVANRDRLIELVVEATLAEMGSRLHGSASVEDLANTFRGFGHERPAAFQLVMSPSPAPRLEVRVAATEDILRIAGDLAGEEHALDAARMLVAWASGFVTMELTDGFGLGGDIEQAWKFGLERIVVAIAS